MKATTMLSRANRPRSGIVAAVAAICALALPCASLARTVSIASATDSALTLAFGDADGNAYTLAWGYGAADGGIATNAWDSFEILGTVARHFADRAAPRQLGRHGEIHPLLPPRAGVAPLRNTPRIHPVLRLAVDRHRRPRQSRRRGRS